MNLHARAVELRSTPETQRGALQKSTDFVKAFMLGFAVADAIALLRLDDLYLDSFDVTDVKPLSGDHLARAIGRVAGKGGKTKYTIENVTKTRIVLADSRIHILGAFQNIRMVRAAPLRAAGAGRSCGRRRRGTPSPTSSSEAPPARSTASCTRWRRAWWIGFRMGVGVGGMPAPVVGRRRETEGGRLGPQSISLVKNITRSVFRPMRYGEYLSAHHVRGWVGQYIK